MSVNTINVIFPFATLIPFLKTLIFVPFIIQIHTFVQLEPPHKQTIFHFNETEHMDPLSRAIAFLPIGHLQIWQIPCKPIGYSIIPLIPLRLLPLDHPIQMFEEPLELTTAVLLQLRLHLRKWIIVIIEV
jgi:hypothetical protein